MIKDGGRFHRYLSLDFTILKKGEDTLFVPTFWVNFHFLVPKLILLQISSLKKENRF